MNNAMNTAFTAILAAIAICAHAEEDFSFVYRGRINPAGVTMPATVPVTYSLYKDANGGDPAWTGTEAVRPNSDGLFQCMLSGDGVAAAFTNANARFLGVSINGEAEQYPRQEIFAAPVVDRSIMADQLMPGGTVDTMDTSAIWAKNATFGSLTVTGNLKLEGGSASITISSASLENDTCSLRLKKGERVSIFRNSAPDSFEFNSLNTGTRMFHTGSGGFVTVMSKDRNYWDNSDGVPCVTWAVGSGDVYPPFNVGHPVKVYFYPFGASN